jgi:hypothetical protein
MLGNSSDVRNVRPCMKRPTRLVSVLLVAGAVLAGACAADDPLDVTAVDEPPTSTAPTTAEVSMPVEPDEADGPVSPLTLYVSNQSFDDPTVVITITIDGTVVADQDFDVEAQHNWIAFDLSVPSGDHRLVARSDSGARLNVDFTTVPDEPRWAVVDYWSSGEDHPANFTFDVSDEPIGFM